MIRTLTLLALFGSAAPALATLPYYKITSLGTPGGYASSAFGIDRSGNVVGTAQLPGSAEFVPFIARPGMATAAIDLSGIGATSGVALGINHHGQIAGNASVGGNVVPFRYDPVLGAQVLPGVKTAVAINSVGTVTGLHTINGGAGAYAVSPGRATTDIGSLGLIGHSSTIGTAINDAGRVTGTSYAPVIDPYYNSITSFQPHAFLYTPRQGMIDLGTLGGNESRGLGINRAGQVTGVSLNSSNRKHAFLYTQGTGMVDLIPGLLESQGNGVNNSGLVVGWVTTSDPDNWGYIEPFIHDGSFPYYLKSRVTNLAGWNFLSDAVAINDRGQIAGTGYFQGFKNAFRLDPIAVAGVPEPASWAMLIGGFGLVGAVLRRRRVAWPQPCIARMT